MSAGKVEAGRNLPDSGLVFQGVVESGHGTIRGHGLDLYAQVCQGCFQTRGQGHAVIGTSPCNDQIRFFLDQGVKICQDQDMAGMSYPIVLNPAIREDDQIRGENLVIDCHSAKGI